MIKRYNNSSLHQLEVLHPPNFFFFEIRIPSGLKNTYLEIQSGTMTKDPSCLVIPLSTIFRHHITVYGLLAPRVDDLDTRLDFLQRYKLNVSIAHQSKLKPSMIYPIYRSEKPYCL